MSQYQFEPVTLSVPITLTEIEIGPYPTVVRSIWGRGDWPHQNIIFPRWSTVYDILERRMEAAYHTLGAQLAMERYLAETRRIR